MSVTFTTLSGPTMVARPLGTRFAAEDAVKVAWADAVTAAREWLAAPGLTFPYFSDDPLAKQARCVECKIDPFWPEDVKAHLVTTTLARYDYAKITRTFTTNESSLLWYPASSNPALATREDAQISEDIEPYLESLPIDYQHFYWETPDPDSASTAITKDECPFKLVHRCTYVLTRYNVPYFPGWAINLIGKVNAADIYPPTWVPEHTTGGLVYWYWPAKTLMMMNPSIKLHLNTLGQIVFDITLKMLYKAEDWEHYYRSKTDAYDRIFSILTGLTFAPATADFSVIYPH